MAHQQPSLALDLPVWENVFLGAERCGKGGLVDRRTSRRQARAVLDELGAQFDLAHPAGMLTAAGQQLVEIARALTRRPRLLILDEPTAPLAAAEVARLFTAVRRMTAQDAGVIFISHRLHEVEEICDRILVLRNGARAAVMETSGGLDERRIIELMTGDPEASPRATPRRRVGETVLRLVDICVGSALRGVSLEIRRGEIVGLAACRGKARKSSWRRWPASGTRTAG